MFTYKIKDRSARPTNKMHLSDAEVRWEQLRLAMLPRLSGGERSTLRNPMDKLYLGETARGVHYLDNLSRKHHQVHFGEERDAAGNEVFEEDIFFVGQEGSRQRANTSSVGANPVDIWWGDPNLNSDATLAIRYADFMYAYVIGMDDILYIAKHEINKFHHSTFWAGRPVKDAGMVHIIDGVLIGLSTKSGHYKPLIEQKIYFLKKIYDRLPASRENKGALAEIVLFDEVTEKYYSAEKLLSALTNNQYTDNSGVMRHSKELSAAELTPSLAAAMIRTRYEKYYEPYAASLGFPRVALPRRKR